MGHLVGNLVGLRVGFTVGVAHLADGSVCKLGAASVVTSLSDVAPSAVANRRQRTNLLNVNIRANLLFPMI